MEDWLIDCSDEEKYESDGKSDWMLRPDEILSLIQALETSNKILELEWKCPGRRGPSPLPSNNRQQDNCSQEYKPEEKSDFDFMDEMSSPRLPVRRLGETPKGSAKKKTASFDGVLSTMLRHRKLEQQEINSSTKKIITESPGSRNQTSSTACSSPCSSSSSAPAPTSASASAS